MIRYTFLSCCISPHRHTAIASCGRDFRSPHTVRARFGRNGLSFPRGFGKLPCYRSLVDTQEKEAFSKYVAAPWTADGYPSLWERVLGTVRVPPLNLRTGSVHS